MRTLINTFSTRSTRGLGCCDVTLLLSSQQLPIHVFVVGIIVRNQYES